MCKVVYTELKNPDPQHSRRGCVLSEANVTLNDHLQQLSTVSEVDV